MTTLQTAPITFASHSSSKSDLFLQWITAPIHISSISLCFFNLNVPSHLYLTLTICISITTCLPSSRSAASPNVFGSTLPLSMKLYRDTLPLPQMSLQLHHPKDIRRLWNNAQLSQHEAMGYYLALRIPWSMTECPEDVSLY